jgi:hypothetical protein
VIGQLRRVLVHVATPLDYVEGTAAGVWIEGEPGASGPEPTRGPTFPCVLFLPGGSEDDAQPRSRKITRPTVLFEPVRPDDWPDAAGTAIALDADSELLISAPELAAWFEQAKGEPAGTGRWQVQGRPQPFGPPGSVIGGQATLKQVEG